MQVLLGHAELAKLPHSTAQYLTSRQFFPHLISPAFSKGLTEAFSFAAGACLLGAVASLLRGGKYHHVEEGGDSDADRVPPRRPWPRPSPCWWTEMAVSTQRKDAVPVAGEGGEAGIRISDAATRVGVSARTLRYYEELGLLTPSLYTSGGERRYTPEDLAHLQRILELREVLGMNLDEIREFLALETRLDELRASYRATRRDATSKKALAEQKATLQEALVLNESLGGADQRQAGAHGRLSRQVAQRCAAVPGAPHRVGVVPHLREAAPR
jgi:DNA-binding transcriptional MerR regulator